MERKNKVEHLNEEEQVKVGDEESNDNEISDMDQLSNEILMKILDYLDKRELVKCRLLSSRWNEISCSLLQDKSKKNPHSKLVVKLKKHMECQIIITKPLEDFLNCFAPTEAEKSSGRRRPFPFSRFHIQRMQFMNMTRICEFVSTFGPHMKLVILEINSEDIANCKSFWKLFLYFAPNIQHLKIVERGYCLKNVMLFDPINKIIAELDPNFEVLTPQDTFLKNLKVFAIESPFLGVFNDFMKDLLDNAPNLQQVSSKDPSHKNSWKHVQVWQQLNKAHLIKKLYIRSFSRIHLAPFELMKDLRLDNLMADCETSSAFVENEISSVNCIVHALKSSQKTLSSLSLWNLNMKFMDLNVEEISPLPNVRQLQISIKHLTETENILEYFSQLCPNATSLNLQFGRGDFSQVVPFLWTQFKELKSLKLRIILTDESDDNSFDLDSAFSGYSKMSLWRIKARLKRGISLEEARRNEPQNPSILDLKGLSRLQLNFRMGTRTEEMEEFKNQHQNTIFIKILPQHIRENPRSICYS